MLFDEKGARSWKKGFDIARAAAQYAVAPRKSRQVGAALFSGSTLISVGMNSYGHSHPDAKWGIHAEHRALLRRQHYNHKNNLIIYVYREINDGTQACSKPCNNCQQLLREAGVRFVRFVNSHGNFEQIQL